MPHKRSLEKREERRRKYQSFEQTKKERDTIRGIFKDLNQRDLLTGEIIMRKENEAAIQRALITETLVIEDWRGQKTAVPLDQSVVSQIVYEPGEVLNRAIEPCWWR